MVVISGLQMTVPNFRNYFIDRIDEKQLQAFVNEHEAIIEDEAERICSDKTGYT